MGAGYKMKLLHKARRRLPAVLLAASLLLTAAACREKEEEPLSSVPSGTDSTYSTGGTTLPETSGSQTGVPTNSFVSTEGTTTAGTTGTAGTTAGGTGEAGTEITVGRTDTLDGGWTGMPSLRLGTGTPAAAGEKYLQITNSADIVFINMQVRFNMTAFKSDGWVHFYVYTDNPSVVTGGQIEFTSSGRPDVNELGIGEFGRSMPLSDFVFQGGALDYAKVNCVRVYFNIAGGSATMGLTDLRVYHGTTKPVDTAYEKAVEKATEQSVLFSGAANNKAAIAAALDKAKQGRPITLVTLGDSITAGHNAGSQLGWAFRVRDWLQKTYPQSKITLVNSGVSATESVFGACRVQKDVLAHKPDLVIVDLGTNDPWHQYYQEAYEGIVSQLLAAGIPVINFNVCPSNGENVQAKQQPVNKRYGIPQISFRSSYWANREENKNITGLRAADIWSSDTVHPTDKGHELIANLITSYLQTAILDAGISPAKQNTALPAPVTANRYKDAILVESKDTLPAGMSIETSGWTADYAARTAEFKTEGWQAKSFGATLTLNVNAGYVELFYMRDAKMGSLEIKVDGKVVGTIAEANPDFVHTYPYHVIHLDSPGNHKVELTLKQRGSVTTPWFGLCAIGVANL